MKNKYRIRSQLIKLFLQAVALLPLSMAHFLGGLLGRLIWFASKKSRRVALVNVAHCFPALSDQEQQQLAYKSHQAMGKNIAELGALWLWPAEKVLKKIVKISGEQYVQEARAKQQGVIFIAPHLGCWEIIGLYLPMLCLYRPPRISQMDAVIRKARTRNGSRLAATDARGVRSVLQALRKGESTGILPDQDPGQGNGVFAPFFGVQANTMTLASKLATKSGACVIFAYAERLPSGKGYHLHFVPASDEIYGENSVTYMNQQVEQLIMQSPSQYLWSYKRFKTRPEGEESFYK